MAEIEEVSTVHLYYGDTALFTCEAKILQQEELEPKDGVDGKQFCLVLDRTVMHPQGGTSRQRQQAIATHSKGPLELVSPVSSLLVWAFQDLLCKGVGQVEAELIVPHPLIGVVHL